MSAWKRWWTQEGGSGEILRLAFPLILSNSCWTLQTVIDRVFLSWYSPEAVGAAFMAVLLFWTPLALLQNTAAYATTFVAQYLGAGRPGRVGPSIWQALYFSLLAGLGFLLFLPLAEPVMNAIGHEETIQNLEIIYFQCLCFSALPTLISAATCSFFAGRGDSWTVFLINATGFAVNAVLDYAWIFGCWGFPALGIAGAGWATVVGMYASAILSLFLLFRHRYREEFATLSGWRFDRELFGRLLRFGIPSGLQWFLDGLAFSVFTFFVGRMGTAELAASSIAFTLNMFAFMPPLGMGQAVTILVGQRLGENRPDLATRSTWTGFALVWLFMTCVALVYVLFPLQLLKFFQGEGSPEQWAAVAILVPVLLRFVAVYSLVDGINMVFSFALKGAGDTRFVMAVSLILSWPIMVLPTWASYHYGWGLYWAWAFASAYIVAQAMCFLLRFIQGKWKTMRVIEAAPPLAEKEVLELQPVESPS